MGGLGSLLDADRAGVVLDRLTHQLVAVRQDEHAAAALDRGERDRLAQARGHLDQVRTALEGIDGVDAFLLVGAQGDGCGHKTSVNATGNGPPARNRSTRSQAGGSSRAL